MPSLPTPEQVKNVWAGDAVWFDAPLGGFRRPGVLAYVGVSGFALFILGIAVLEADEALQAMVLFGAVLLAIVLIADGLAIGNRWLAKRLLRAGNPKTLRELAVDCWLRSLVGGPRGVRFDAAEWIRWTGPDGPRVILREVKLPPVQADGAINEEEPIDTWTERRKAKRRGLWLLLPGYALVYWLIVGARPGSAWRPENLLFLAYMAVFGAIALSRLGVLGISMSAASAYPGGLRVLSRRGPIEFRRDDSVVLLEPQGTSAVVRATATRIDGRIARMTFTSGPSDPMLARLLSRWSWRGGAGLEWHGQPLRDTELLGQAPTPSGSA